MYGKSTLNQRIEAWWGVFKKLGIHWWINLFKDYRDTGMFDLDNPVVKECLRFCFMDALQTDLGRIANHMNSHEIRHRGYAELPSVNQMSCILCVNGQDFQKNFLIYSLFCIFIKKNVIRFLFLKIIKSQYSNCENKLNECYIKYIKVNQTKIVVGLELYTCTSCFLYVIITYLLIFNTY